MLDYPYIISGKPKPKLTKRRLRQLNRTESTRFILDNKADVPLLPDLTRTRGPGKRVSLDTDDKETQTSVSTFDLFVCFVALRPKSAAIWSWRGGEFT